MTSKNTLETKLHDMAASHFKPNEPGASIIVMRDGEPLLRAGFGLANIELGVSIQPDMVFRLGSITKQFTAVAILMLEERGQLSLQDPIERFIPDYPTHGHKITVEHLLTHTSGIKSYTSMPDFWADQKEDKAVLDHINVFRDQPMAFAPGERWDYNNSGYFLLGAIIENVSGRSYEDFLKQNIFDRLGMTHTYFDLPMKIIPGRVAGYGKGVNGLENAAYISMTRPYAAGSLASTVDDLAKWDAALYTNDLIDQTTLKRAWTPFILNSGADNQYGYGWSICAYQGHTCIEHGGGIHGFNTFAIRIPERRVYVAALMNAMPPPVSPMLLGFKLAALAIDKPYPEPVAISLKEELLKQFVGRYEVSRAVVFTIIVTLQSGQLFVQFSEGEPTQEIVALSPTAFFLKESLWQIRFVMDATGQVQAAQIWDRDLLAAEGIRVKP